MDPDHGKLTKMLCVCTRMCNVTISTSSLVPRPERGRRKGPGFHCLRMRLHVIILPDIHYSKQTKESGSILTPPGRYDGSHTKHPIVKSQVAVRGALPPEDIREHNRELL